MMKKSLLLPFVAIALAFMVLPACNRKSETSNPLLVEWKTPFALPPFEKISAAHYIPAFEAALKEAENDIQSIASDKRTPDFKNTFEALDRAGSLLSKIEKVFYAQASANTNDSLQQIEIEITPKLSAFRDGITMNPDLFRRVKHVYENRSSYNLSDEQTFLLENLYKSFIRNGAALDKKDQDTLKMINQKLSVLSVRFSQNVLAETNNYRLFITSKDDLKGLPATLTAAAAEEAKAAGREGAWAFTTKRPSIFPFLTYSGNREKRKEIYNAYLNRCNNGNEFDNNAILDEMIRLRLRRAKLLGYPDHSSFVLEQRMAKNPASVFSLLDELWKRALPVAVKERDELQKILDGESAGVKLDASDWWYYAEKLRKSKYDLDDNELRPYFSLENVRNGAFDVAKRLYGISFEPLEGAPLPHPEAQAFEVKEKDGTHIGVLYMDFFPRPGKQQGAWCTDYRTHHFENGREITPVVSTVFNFTRPAGDTPALLSLEEVTTLFHEFGHALDFLFSKSTYNQTFTPWDFVELPSQIMEHWATEPEVLRMYARNYKTGEPIPDALTGKITKSRFFNQGFETVEYLAASLLDMYFHTLTDTTGLNIQKLEKSVIEKIGLINEIKPRYRSTYFLHITGGYDSGYYSYIWSAVLDNDAYEAFREKGLFDSSVAASFRKNILEKGGTMDAMKMFVNFRGREPVIEPLLKNRGLI